MQTRLPKNPRSIEVLFGTAERTVRIRCNDPHGASLVRRCYLPYLLNAERDGSTRDYLFERRASDWCVSGPGGAGEAVHTGAWDAVADLEYRLTLDLLAGVAPVVHLHAAGLVCGERAVLAMGGSGAGKSSLAVTWSLSGRPVLGDDTTFLDERAVTAPFKRLFKLNPGEFAKRGGDLRATPFWEDGCDEVWFDPGDHGGWSDPAPLGLIVLLDRRDDAVPGVADIDRSEALNLVRASLMPTGLHGEPAFDRVLEAVRLTRTVRITCADVGYVADSVERLLG